MPVLRGRLFGAPRFWVDEQPIEVRSAKAFGLLCYLVATRHVHSRDRLAGFLWPDVPERNALASLRTALYDIRRALGDTSSDVLFVDRTRVGLQETLTVDVDVAALEQLGTQSGTNDPETLQGAVDAYGGPMLDGVSLPDAYDFEDWVFLERERLVNLHITAMCHLGEHRGAAGDYEGAIGLAKRVLAEDPLREDVHRALMTFYAQSGQRALAVAQYQVCADRLRQELGVAPLEATTELHERIRANEPVSSDSAGPAPVNRAAAARFVAPPPDPLATLDERAGFIGRDQALDALLADWRRAAEGRGGVVLVDGEAGIGKTRLVYELLRRVESEDAAVLYGRCYESTTVEPYGPIVDALRRLLPTVDLDALDLSAVWLRELARIVPELEEVVPGGLSAPLDGVRDRDRLFEGVRSFVAALALGRPVLLIVDDLHWSDETSLSLLSYLARSASAQRLLTVVTYRGEELGAERRSALRPLAASARRLDLEGLSAEETAALVEALSQAEGRPVRFGRRLHRSTGGNPFFLIETLRALFEQRSLGAGDDGWATTQSAAEADYATLPIPETVELIVASRLDRLCDDARGLLECAAVLRRDFAFDVVQQVSGLPPSTALDALDDLMSLGVLRELSTDDAQSARYDFAHALVRDHVYGALTGARRQYLHRQVAGLLEATHPVAPDRVAYHYLRGGVRDRACAWSLRAAGAALAVYAGESALVHFRSARELAVDRQEEFEALSGIGDAFVTLGRHREAIRSYQAALPHAPGSESAAELHRRIGRAHERQGAYDLALDAYAEARAALHGQPLSLASVRIADGLATVYVRLGRHTDATELCHDALRWLAEHAHDEGTREAEAWLRNTLGMAQMHAGDYERAIENLNDSLALKRALGDRLGEATLLNNIGVVHYHCGDDLAASQQYAASLGIKTEIGDTYGRAIALTNLALMETHLGRHDEAQGTLAAAEAAAGDVGAVWLTPEIRRVAAQRALATGDIDGAMASAEAALEAAESLGVPGFIGVAHRVLGQVMAAAAGEATSADAHFETSLAVFEMLENEHELAKTHAAYGQSLIELGRSGDAEDHLRLAADVFERSGARGRLSRVEPFLGD